jgi:hypothetical protein
MLESYLGETCFATASAATWRRTPGNTTTANLWQALEHSPEAGDPHCSVLHRAGRRAADIGGDRVRHAGARGGRGPSGRAGPAALPPRSWQILSRSGRRARNRLTSCCFRQHGNSPDPAAEAIRSISAISAITGSVWRREPCRAGKSLAQLAPETRQFPRRHLGDGAGRPRRAAILSRAGRDA